MPPRMRLRYVSMIQVRGAENTKTIAALEASLLAVIGGGAGYPSLFLNLDAPGAGVFFHMKHNCVCGAPSCSSVGVHHFERGDEFASLFYRAATSLAQSINSAFAILRQRHSMLMFDILREALAKSAGRLRPECHAVAFAILHARRDCGAFHRMLLEYCGRLIQRARLCPERRDRDAARHHIFDQARRTGVPEIVRLAQLSLEDSRDQMCFSMIFPDTGDDDDCAFLDIDLAKDDFRTMNDLATVAAGSPHNLTVHV